MGKNQYTARMETHAEELVSRHDGWKYVGGYTGIDGWADIKHLECGTVMRKSVVSIRKSNTLRCPECEKRKKEEREQTLAEEREAKAKERHEKKLAMFSGETMAFKVCVVCGGLFVGGRGNKMCCSSECSRKHSNTMSSRRKDRRFTREQMIDRDIDLYKLFMRDKGICHICGGLCDWNDIEERESGMVAGNMYPSIDHVLPIAKGGTHQWSNVKLAHRICNSLKSDKTA